MMKKLLIALSAGGVLATPAFALDPNQGNMTVKATVEASCNVVSTTTLDFGVVKDISADNHEVSPGGVTFYCTRTTPWFVTADTGLNFSGSGLTMIGAGDPNNKLQYTLSSTPDWVTPFPTTFGAGDLGNGQTGGTGNGDPANLQTVAVHGTLLKTGILTPDNYTDTVVLTVNF
jgi:spore coat protein U-like protein